MAETKGNPICKSQKLEKRIVDNARNLGNTANKGHPKIPERKKINTPQKRMRPINENNIFLLKHLQQAQQINPRLRLGI